AAGLRRQDARGAGAQHDALLPRDRCLSARALRAAPRTVRKADQGLVRGDRALLTPAARGGRARIHRNEAQRISTATGATRGGAITGATPDESRTLPRDSPYPVICGASRFR